MFLGEELHHRLVSLWTIRSVTKNNVTVTLTFSSRVLTHIYLRDWMTIESYLIVNQLSQASTLASLPFYCTCVSCFSCNFSEFLLFLLVGNTLPHCWHAVTFQALWIASFSAEWHSAYSWLCDVAYIRTICRPVNIGSSKQLLFHESQSMFPAFRNSGHRNEYSKVGYNNV